MEQMDWEQLERDEGAAEMLEECMLFLGISAKLIGLFPTPGTHLSFVNTALHLLLNRAQKKLNWDHKKMMKMLDLAQAAVDDIKLKVRSE